MSMTAAPIGLVLRKSPNATPRANLYTIAAAYATGIGKGDLVSLNTNGTITQSASAADAIGVLAGVEYIDVTGKPTVSPNWPTGGVAGATNIKAYVYDDPDNIYAIQVGSGGAGFDQTILGAQSDLVVAVPTASTGLSNEYLNATPKAAGVQGQLRVVGFEDGLYDATLNPFPVVLVQLAQHQFVANKVSI